MSSFNADTSINALIFGTQWASGVITFSFPPYGSIWSTDATSGYGPNTTDTREPWSSNFAPLSSDDIGAVRTALTSWANVANLHFNEVADTSTSVGDLRFAYSYTAANDDAQAWSYYPLGYASGVGYANSGDVWFNSFSTSADSYWTPGSYAYLTVIHEIGHALGLKHSFGTSPFNSQVMPVDHDGRVFTVMSYSAYPGKSDTHFSYEPTTPMILDIAAIQSLYGANTSYNSGNTNYVFSGLSTYNETIWDAGGIDTFIYNSSVGGQINLTAGLSAGSVMGQPVYITDSYGLNLYTAFTVRIAIGAIIENATGGSGDDSITGNTYNNVIIGGLGNDKLNGGAGIDTASYAGAGAGVTVNLGLTSAQNTVGAGTDTLLSFENLTGSSFNDTLTGTSGNNVLTGGSGTDTVSYANAGAGVTANLGLTSAQNTVGAGTDTLLSFENLTGSSFNDTLTGNSGNNVLNGGSGTDTVSYANAGAGVTANLGLTAAQNTVGAGADTLLSFENLTGSSFNDTLTGNSGNNVIKGGLGNDNLNGGAGIDTASYAGAGAGVTANLGLTSAQNTVGAGTDTLLSFENLTGSSFSDTLTGNSGNNVLNGDLGNDKLFGGAGNDIVAGGNGNDTLSGGLGIDYFCFNTSLNTTTNDDLITDFNPTDDSIQLENSIMTALGSTTGTLASSKFYAGAAAHDADDAIIYNHSTGGLYYDSDGTGSSAAVQIATIGTTTHASLTYADFLVV
jgi:Ca2+-binding RTX toxin-like protein